MAITIPYGYTPRDYQVNVLRALDSGMRNICWIVHRRGGKDVTMWNYMIKRAFQEPGTYYYFLPTFAQAKRVIWDGMINDGKKMLDFIPKEIIEGKPNNTEMKVWINGPNGQSLIQLIGADAYDAIMGTNPRGVVFSEWSLMDPMAYEYIKPILAANRGWSAFIFTPRGRNHGWELYQLAKDNPDVWFTEVLTVEDTKVVMPPARIEEERKKGMPEDLIQQEYFCNFSRGQEGAYYGKQMEELSRKGHVTRVEYDPAVPVRTYWDLGVGDSTAIWWAQFIHKEIHLVNYYENSGEGLAHYIRVLDDYRKETGCVYDLHVAPHDISARELTSGKSRLETARRLGISFRAAPRLSLESGIEAVRMILHRCWFDKAKCEHGIKCLEGYRKTYNEKFRVYGDKPFHDWCFTGDTKVLTRYGMCRMMDLPENGEVLTLCGWKQYTNPRITRKNAPLVEVRFVDGLTVRCTPEHSFLTVFGWRFAKHLAPHTEIQSSLTSLHNISMEDCIARGQMTNTCLEEGKGFTEKSGVRRLERFLKGVISIIKTGTQKIISLATWSACQPKSIYQKLGTVLMQKKERLVTNAEEKRLNGIDPKKEDCGIKDMLNAQKGGQNGKESRENVYFAENYLIASSENQETSKNTVTQVARPLIIENVEHLDYKEDVWCLTVPEVEHFSLSNGAVVHNCSHGSDAFRMLAITESDFRPDSGVSDAEYDLMRSRWGWMT